MDHGNQKDRHENECEESSKSGGTSVLVAQAPGATLQAPETLLSAFTILNRGKERVRDVEITSLKLPNGALNSDTPVPIKLGSLPPQDTAYVSANFNGGPFQPSTDHVLTIEGTYVPNRDREKEYHHKNRRKCFKARLVLNIPPGAPGSAPLKSVTIGSHAVEGGKYPTRPPKFDHEVNSQRWTVPRGIFSAGVQTETRTVAEKAPIGDPPGIDFKINNSVKFTAGSSTVAEPSGGADANGLVFVTTNWLAAFSTDHGSTFHTLNPTNIFPADAVGFCCDQIVQYVPQIDRVVWLLQGNGNRLAVASPAAIQSSNGTAWTYWNLSPDVFGQPGIAFDYPDLAVGNDFLYISWNAGVGCSGCDWGHQVARISLAGLQAGGTVTVQFTDPANGRMAWGAHLTQDTFNEIFWAGHNSNSQMRVFSLAENSNFYFWRDVNVSSWAPTGLSSLTPDNQDWMTKLRDFPGSAVLGSTRVGNQVWFAWSAGTDNHFAQPHVEMVALDRDHNFNKLQQVQVWNDAYAFAYPALSRNQCTNEIGFSMEYGGGGNFENQVVGFWGDFLAYITTDSNAGATRFGDYVSIRQTAPPAQTSSITFDAFGYGLRSIKPGATPGSDIHYIVFGRPGECQIIE